MQRIRCCLNWFVPIAFCAMTARAQSSIEMLTMLKTAAAQTSLYDEGLKPWHLKMTVTLTNPEGGQESGTLEEWHNGPKQWRIVYDLPSYRGSTAHTETGSYRTAGLGTPPFPLTYLESAELRPLPRPEDLAQAEITSVDTGLNNKRFRCISVGHAPMSDERRAHNTNPAFCFDTTTLRFEVTVQYRSLVTVRDQTGNFEGRTVPIRLVVTSGGKPFASGQVTVLQAHADPYPEAWVTDGLEKQEESPVNPSARGLVVAGALLTHVQPVYPPLAKSQHVQGTVFLHVIIGKDGKVRDLSVITTPSRELSEAAMEAVRHWIYRPYLLNGSPAEVDTTVAINFSLGTPFS